MTKISVAIPSYVNSHLGISYLRETFDSIKKQSFSDYEVVVSDNSPNDFVEKLCDEYLQYFSILYKRNNDHVGMSANSNYSMSLCSGEYIKILHCDDLLFSDISLETIVKSLDANPDKYWLVNGFNHTHDGKNFFDERVPTYPDHLLIGNNLMGCPTNVTIRNRNVDYFDLNLSTSMDHEWYHRLRIKYGMPLILTDVLTTSRIHDNNTTSTLDFDIVLEADGTSWKFIQSELDYLQMKHKDFFETWEYSNG